MARILNDSRILELIARNFKTLKLYIYIRRLSRENSEIFSNACVQTFAHIHIRRAREKFKFPRLFFNFCV